MFMNIYANQRIASDKVKAKNLLSNMTYRSNESELKADKEKKLNDEIKKHARNYIVKKFLSNTDINVLINNIKPELFS